MKQIAQKVKASLAANENLVNLIDDRIYWSLGPEKLEAPFVLFDIAEIKGLSKDRRGHNAIVRCFGSNMDVASDVYEAVKTVLENARHDFVSGQSGITDDEFREAVMELNFNLKNI